MFHRGMRRAKKSTGRKTVAQKTYRELVPVLDTEYSQYRRMSVAVLTRGILTCSTCSTRKHWKEMDLGHYITRAIHATRWTDENTAIQCPKCNRYMGGLQHLMREHLISVYGVEAVEALELRSKMGNGETADTLREKIGYYREKNRELRAELK